MKELKFKVKLEGVTSGEVAALSAPFDVEKTFGTRARVPVRGTINGGGQEVQLKNFNGNIYIRKTGVK